MIGAARIAILVVPCLAVSCSYAYSLAPIEDDFDAGYYPTSDAGTDAAPDAFPVSDAATDSPYASAVMVDAPIAFWRMNIELGDVVPDESGHGHALKLAGSGHLRGQQGATAEGNRAIVFDGVSSGATAGP